MTVWQPIKAGARTEEDFSARAWRIALAKRLAPFFRHRPVLSVALHVALKRAEAEQGFRLSPFFAQAYFGPRLLLDIDPRRITHSLPDWVSDGRRRIHTTDCFLSAARWDGLVRPLSSGSVWREIDELFAAGLDHRATRTYARMVKALAKGKLPNRHREALDSKEAIERYFDGVRALIESIRTHGVVAHQNEEAPFSPDREIGIAIGPADEILRLPGAQHRIAIARAIGCKSIPVEVRMIHTSVLRECGGDPVDAVAAAIAAVKS